MAFADRAVGPVPGCPKVLAWTERKDAREHLLHRWSKGDFRCNGTHWCKYHEAFHLTSKAKRAGKNYMYRD